MNVNNNVNSIELKATNPSHIGYKNTDNNIESEFSNMFFDAIKDVDNLQKNQDSIMQKSIVDSTDLYSEDITIAMSESYLSLSITKNIVDKMLQAYRDISNLR